MSDAISSIDTLALGTAGCASYVYTERSVQPFVRDVFDQFSETKTGGTFTFMTGIGGFLQEFLYGYSGLRWNAENVQLSPSLTGQMAGLVLHNVLWHGRRFTVTIGARTTALSLDGGGNLLVKDGSIMHSVSHGHTLTVPTRRPDLSRTSDRARCQSATASSSVAGSPALAAVDGSPATDWQPATLPATLSVPLSGGKRAVSGVTLIWGQSWPAPPAPNVAPPPGPVVTLRSQSYTVAASTDGQTWTTVATVTGTTGTTDVLHFPPTPARDIRISMASSTAPTPELDEFTVGT